MHAMIALSALQLKKHVYCQKPLTRTIAEARAMIAAAGKDGTVASLGQGGIMAVVGDNTLLRDRFGVRPEMSMELLVEQAGMAPAVTP
jgi:hypothetical protein